MQQTALAVEAPNCSLLPGTFSSSEQGVYTVFIHTRTAVENMLPPKFQLHQGPAVQKFGFV